MGVPDWVQVKKNILYTLQPTCNLSRNAIASQVAKKVVPCKTEVCQKIVYV